jgi:release factor glutamine methyltransferase
MKISESLKKNLENSKTPRLDLEILLREVLQKPRSFLFANPDHELSKEEEDFFQELYLRRRKGEPIAYILGKKEFWSREFAVNNKVLIPRPETELLIEIILQDFKKEKANIADLGTGSGVIALTLACERPSWNVVATDICADALQVASYNAMQIGVQNIEFYRGSWCEALPKRKFDLIVSNPPYGQKSNPILQQEDVRFEPQDAVTPGEDGLIAFRQIVEQAKDKLNEGGLLLFEFGYDQSEQIQVLLCEHGYQDITVHKDLAGIDRAIKGAMPFISDFLG